MKTVPEFIEESKGSLPPLMTVERSTQSKYMFLSLVRHFRKRVKPAPVFLTYTKADQENIKATIEEHSAILAPANFYVLEGFSLRFVEGLRTPPDTYILAETDNGELKVPPYSYKQTRDLLRMLYSQLNMASSKTDAGTPCLQLRDLVQQDWSQFRSYEEFEPLLRKAKILHWTAADLEKSLAVSKSGNLLTLIKRGQDFDTAVLAEKYGVRWAIKHLMESTADLTHYRALRLMGYDESKCGKEMGQETSYKKLKEMEEANQMLTAQDLETLTSRILDLDRLSLSRPDLAYVLLTMNSGISVRRQSARAF